MTVYRNAPAPAESAITVSDFNFWYGDFHALTDVNLNIAKNKITAFIGPSGCGKSTFLRCMNRMNDLIEGTRNEGAMELDGANIYAEGVDPVDLRRRVGMIFQQPNPFPKSIYENVAFGPRLQGVTSKSDSSTTSSRSRSSAPTCGRRSPVSWARTAWRSPAASSSACASPVCSRSSQTCCSWTSPARPSTPRACRRSRTSWPSSRPR